MNNNRLSYTYNANNSEVEYLRQNWNGSAWVNFFKWSYTYDGNNNPIEDLYQTWNGSAWVNVNKFMYSHLPTGIEQIEGELSTYNLSNNYPNPFNPTTTIKFQIPEMGFIALKIYDILGNEITTLVNEELQAGNYEVEFDASSISSGIYFYRLQSGSFVETKKMILLK
ncbi:MAG: T9SS type A sorting domain-containing protein [bacterium]|nr:T9SS type A sorting domain-containing protein [bacterium]